MGWVQRIFRPFASREARRRPWVSPQFLGIVAGLGLLSAGAYAMVQTGAGPANIGGTDSAQRGGSDTVLREYVGFEDLAELERFQSLANCPVDCQVEQAWNDWLAVHPGVEILARLPVLDGGVVVGYWVDYRPA